MYLPRLRTESEDLLHVDVARFVAASGIVFHHAVGYTSFGWSSNLEELRLFVDFFFVISGYVIAFVYQDRIDGLSAYRNFIVKRLARLVPLHWALLAAFAAMGLVIFRAGIEINSSALFDPKCFLPNALLIHAMNVCDSNSFNGPSWSISAEMGMYAVTPIVLVLVRHRTVALGIVFLSVLALEAHSSPSRHWTEWTFDAGVVRAFPSFVLGMLLRQNRQLVARIPYPLGLAGALFVIFLTGVWTDAPPTALLLTMYALAATLVCADLAGDPHPFVRRSAPLGQLTYSSYMIHIFVFSILVSPPVVQRLGLSDAARNWSVLGAVALVWIASYFSYLFFENPARRAIGRLATR